MIESELEIIKNSIINLDFAGAEKAANDAMNKGISPIEAIESIVNALDIAGEKFENMEYFLPELVVAGEIAKETMKIIEPFINSEMRESKGKIILATVDGDIHDIGKNVVNVLLTAAGFEVIDLGVNVPTDQIIEAVRMNKPHILGLSTLITITMVEMEKIINKLIENDLRNNLKIIVGGSPVSDEYAMKIGADHRAVDAVEGVNKCRQWMAELR
ncbi:MAG: cobalamin B12-binding domain-containing protein [Promethearchaeota archaeon]|jgi:methylmalonyl-CoA mutase cobalamin-binding domain/chain